MGAVLEAVQEPIGRRVAVKVLHRKYAQEPLITARFFNEARAVNLIDHPGIVQVSDYGQLPDGTAYLVMEFLKGETLNQRAKRGALSLPEIVRIARQIGAALAAAHEKNVFHRDLKPDNIMIIPEQDAETPGRERVKLLDFGIAKVVTDEEEAAHAPKTATDVVMGTPRYMAPEQCRGGVTVDGKADVYSMGVLLFELLVGKPPFSGASGEVLAKHIYETPPPLRDLAPHVPEELTKLIHRMLAKKREERPSMQEVQTALDQVSIRHPTAVLQAIKWTPAPGGIPTPPSSPGMAAPGIATPTPLPTPLPTPEPAIPAAAQSSTLGLSTGQAELFSVPRRLRVWIPVVTFVAAFAIVLGVWRGLRSKPPVHVPSDAKPIVTTNTPGEHKAAIEVSSLRVHFTVTTAPPGAQVLRSDDNKLLGTTPWSSTEDAAPGQIELRLHLPGYADKLIELDRSTDAVRAEVLDPAKKPLHPGSGRGSFIHAGQNSTTKPNANGSKTPNTHEEQPRIVD
jgi:serine/threonine protein kinase